jgi:hypothetical protein
LNTREGLSAWWTNNTRAESKVGGVLQFRFEAGGFDMKVLELHPTKRLAGGLALLHGLSAWQPIPNFPINVPVDPDMRTYTVALLLALVSGLKADPCQRI